MFDDLSRRIQQQQEKVNIKLLMFLVLVSFLVCPWLVGERDSNAAQSWEGPTSSVAGDGDAEESSVVGKPLTGALASRRH